MKKIVLLLILGLVFFTGCTTKLNKKPKKEDFQSIDKVSMKIKEVTLTNTSATVVIRDLNKVKCQFGEEFKIETKKNDKWEELKMINEPYWILAVYSVGNNNELELNQNWKEIYGTLSPGKYRLIKSVHISTSKNNVITVEFEIK